MSEISIKVDLIDSSSSSHPFDNLNSITFCHYQSMELIHLSPRFLHWHIKYSSFIIISVARTLGFAGGYKNHRKSIFDVPPSSFPVAVPVPHFIDKTTSIVVINRSPHKQCRTTCLPPTSYFLSRDSQPLIFGVSSTRTDFEIRERNYLRTTMTRTIKIRNCL